MSVKFRIPFHFKSLPNSHLHLSSFHITVKLGYGKINALTVSSMRDVMLPRLVNSSKRAVTLRLHKTS